MTAANHVLFGALIATVIKEPAVALPLALLSHFALDVLPHFGFDDWADRSKHQAFVNYIIYSDGLMLFAVLTWLVLVSPGGLLLLCGLLAASPDVVWVYRYIFKEKFGSVKVPYGNWFTKFHSSIQKLEFRKGLFVEYPVMVTLILILNNRI